MLTARSSHRRYRPDTISLKIVGKSSVLGLHKFLAIFLLQMMCLFMNGGQKTPPFCHDQTEVIPHTYTWLLFKILINLFVKKKKLEEGRLQMGTSNRIEGVAMATRGGWRTTPMAWG